MTMPFRRIPEALLLADDLTLDGLRVFAAVQHHDRGVRGCFATVSTLSKWAKCCRRTTLTWLAWHVDQGFLTVEKSPGKTSKYRVVSDEVVQIAAQVNDGEVCNSLHPTSANDFCNTDENQWLGTNKDRMKESSVKLEKESPDKSAPLSQDETGVPAFSRASFRGSDGHFNVGGYLAALERRLKTGALSLREQRDAISFFDLVTNEFPNGSPEYGVAYRLIQSGNFSEEAFDLWRASAS